MLIPPTRAHSLTGMSWRRVATFNSAFFTVEKIEKWALLTKLRGPVQYRIVHAYSGLVVAESVSMSGLVDDWNCIITKAGSENATIEDLLDLGFDADSAQAALATARHHPLAYMNDLVLLTPPGHDPRTSSPKKAASRFRRHHLTMHDLPGPDLLFRRFTTGRPGQDTAARSLDLLDMLLLKGFLDEKEYEIRKEQVLKMNQTEADRQRSKDNRDHWMAEAFPLKKPKPEKVNLWRYDAKLKHWNKTAVEVFISPTVYAKGSMRLAYRMKIPGEARGRQEFIAKKFIREEDDDNERYFTDVLMQSLCQRYAEEFNTHSPPKKVQFIDACIVELSGRKCKPDGWNQLMAVEPFMPGEYQKYNNNFGWVSYVDRNTPQAFSHFTYVASNGEHLVTDIQGVGDMYTDPQIHSWDGQGFGDGNYGRYGIEKFFSTHYCNSMCQYLGLTDKEIKGMQATGLKESRPPVPSAPGLTDASLCSTHASLCPSAAGLRRPCPPLLPGPVPRRPSGQPDFSDTQAVLMLTATGPIPSRSGASVRKAPQRRRGSRTLDGAGTCPKPPAGSRLAEVFQRHPRIDLEFYNLTEEQFVQVATIFEGHCTAAGTVARDQLLPILRDLGIEAPLEELADMVVNLDKDTALPFEGFLCWWTGVEVKASGEPLAAKDPGGDLDTRRSDGSKPRTPLDMVASLGPPSPRSGIATARSLPSCGRPSDGPDPSAIQERVAVF